MKELTKDSFWSRLWGLLTARHLGRRVNRTQFIYAQLMPLVVSCLLAVLIPLIASFDYNNNITTIIYTAVFAPLVIVCVIWAIKSQIGRLHDCNCSGWWLLPVAILTRFLYIPGLLLFFWPGTKGANNYGETPAQIRDEERECAQERA